MNTICILDFYWQRFYKSPCHIQHTEESLKIFLTLYIFHTHQLWIKIPNKLYSCAFKQIYQNASPLIIKYRTLECTWKLANRNIKDSTVLLNSDGDLTDSWGITTSNLFSRIDCFVKGRCVILTIFLINHYILLNLKPLINYK